MTEPTDKTIEILCPECDGNHFETGVQAMYEHILKSHPIYGQHEADFYALKWMENSYDAIDRQNERLTQADQHEKRHRAFWGKR